MPERAPTRTAADGSQSRSRGRSRVRRTSEPAEGSETSETPRSVTQRESDPEPAEVEFVAVGEVDDGWATGDELGTDDGFVPDVWLPMMRKRVRVRILETEELMRLGMAPDLTRSAELLSKLIESHAGDEEADLGEADADLFVSQMAAWYSRIAHLAIVPRHDPLDVRLCVECGYAHPETLFTLRRTKRMQRVDWEIVSEQAVLSEGASAALPFFGGLTRRRSESLADTGT